MEVLSWLLPLAAVAFSLFLAFPVIKAWLARGKQVDLPREDAGLLAGRKLVYFMAPHCGMCRSTTPIIDALRRERDDVVMVDASARPELARALHVMATPSFVVVDNGRVEKLVVGAKSQRQILKMLDG
ncbi:MAG TPA: thioredoxin [Rhodobacteraceae bacterium]|nr:thioredoxin [Paracoccaceae bacterium]